jgi:hypothetical protein
MKNQVSILIVDGDRLCSHCGDTGMMRHENGRGGFTSERCDYCTSYERLGIGKSTYLEPRLPPLTGGRTK